MINVFYNRVDVFCNKPYWKPAGTHLKENYETVIKFLSDLSSVYLGDTTYVSSHMYVEKTETV